MRVLIIDDDQDVRKELCRALNENEQHWEVDHRDFIGLSEALLRFRPDLLVLDLLGDQVVAEQVPGNKAFDEIRETWFCPVVVYSAYPQRQDFEHALVRTVEKGSDSELKVLQDLRDFVAHAEMIRSVHRDFDARIREALRDSVEALSMQTRNDVGGVQDEDVPRAVRRLVAARVDARDSGEGKLKAWERFIVPPLGDHLLTADLLKLRRSDARVDETDFRLVLTPSCDLVPRGTKPPTAEHVLVACCERLERLGSVALKQGKKLNPKQKDRLQSIITEGMADKMLPIPEFQGKVPMMVANLGRLELLEWPVDDKFERVASTDSPFREMVVWAYLRVTGRPGLPEIDVDGWLENLSGWLANGNGS